ncbi:gamma-humulene synthase-like isoform X1 [Cryptomeria japonica]|uniref:gamma-humulene synthase-like isoform X1 n=1 Tax=Cryptomeria japonica TaxID=3369 RepID=UPI0027DA3161|nr:gamma-humulene synthase-like isoform X1 [Cryptomeria japonica]
MSTLKGDNISSISSVETPQKYLNLWNDEFVQSMETPYGGSEYRERVETLVKEVKMFLKEMQTGLDGDLIERLEMVDALQCLGIDPYFQAEIKEALDYVYGCWDGSVGMGLESRSVTKNLNATALGLRLLRLHRYGVSVEYALLYEWTHTFSRWEAQNFIEIYEEDNFKLKDNKILELAKLDFNILQFVYKMEMKKVSSWWAECEIIKLISIRQRPMEYYLLGVSAADEEEFCSSRMAFTKSTTLLSLVDDLLDDYLTFEQAELVVRSITQGWDISIVQDIPVDFKRILEFIFQTVHELANEATGKQGRDMMPFITKVWADYAEASLQQAQWNISKHVPTYNEYMNIASTTAAIGPLLLHPLLLATQHLEDNTIQKTFNNQCRFYELIWMSSRLIDDFHDYQDDKLHGQIASTISCYMIDHLECSEEEAINHINYMIDQLLKELTWEFLNQDSALLDWEKISFNFNRGLQCFYAFGDGFSYHDKGIKNRIKKVLVDPIKF